MSDHIGFPRDDKRVALFLAFYDVGACGQITNAAVSLGRRGYLVDLFLYRAGYAELAVSILANANVRTYVLDAADAKSSEGPNITVEEDRARKSKVSQLLKVLLIKQA